MIRLYLPEGKKLSSEQIHYIKNVMRKSKEDYIKCFNDEGEWLCNLDGNRIRQIREKEFRENKTIVLGCIKKNRLELLVEKITEIGITHLQLIETEYSQRITYDMQRLLRISIEATEQSGWLCPIRILPAISLPDFLNKIQNFQEITLCYQNGSKTMSSKIKSALIGPEGGWSPKELEMMRDVNKLCLGNSILRSETAAIIASYLLTSN